MLTARAFLHFQALRRRLTSFHYGFLVLALLCAPACSKKHDGGVPGTAPEAPPAAPTLASFQPVLGPPGTVITLTGTGFTTVKVVSFGGVPADTTTIHAADDTSLTVTVPASAVTGFITVNTPNGSVSSAPSVFTIQPAVPTPAGGPIPVPGGNLAILGATLVITSLAPPQGVPGTEVTLTGSGFTGTSQVAYAGVPLDPSRFDVDTDSRIRVRVPDDAQADGAIAVATAAGGPVASVRFVLTPSRRSILSQPLDLQPAAFGDGACLNFPTRRRSAIYDTLNLPQAPVFHAYNPDGVSGGRDGNRAGHFITECLLNLKLPTANYYDVLPDAIKNQLQLWNLAPAALDILVVSQDYQYDGVTPADGVYLYRPHYWTDPDAPTVGNHHGNHALTAGVYLADPGVTFSGRQPGVVFNFNITTHGPGPILASPHSEPMGGFDVNTSTGLWSLVHEPATGRAAATLHQLYNDADQTAFAALSRNVTTIQGLGLNLAQSSFAASRGVQMFLTLVRPLIGAVTQAPVAGTANKLVVLTGTCLAGASAVHLDGVPQAAGTFRGVSDAVVQATLPVGATGNLQVVTPLGISDPVRVSAD